MMGKVVVVTGGIGSGKSEVCAYLSSIGIPVYDCDSSVKRLYNEDPEIVIRLEKILGCTLRSTDGKLDKALLSEIIFNDSVALSKVESLVFPALLGDFMKWKRAHESSQFLVMESATILDKPLFNGVYDLVVLVDAPEELRLQRACKRDNKPVGSVLERLRLQNFDKSRADAIIENDSDKKTLCERTKQVFESLKNNNMENQKKTELAKILSVSGHSGLFLYIAQARNGAIVESLSTKTRTCISMKNKITTLADISIYTDEGELKLKDVFEKLHGVLAEEDAPTSKASAEELKDVFAKAVPNYDGDRFYVSHMKKVVEWYNELKKYASLDFAAEGETVPESEASQDEQ